MAEDFARLAAQFSASRYAQLLGLTVTELSPGYARVTMQTGPEFHNWSNMTHGGALMSLADHAFGCCLNTLESVYVAVQFTTQFVAAPKDGELLVAEGKVVRAGRRVGQAEITITGDEGRLIARCLGTTVPVGPRQTQE